VDHPNAKLARIAWEAVSASDVASLRQVCAEELVWHASGRGPRSGEYRGRDAVLDYLATIGDAADRFDSRLDHVQVNESLVAVLFHVSGRLRSRVLDTDFILIFRIESGRIAEVWAVPRDQHAVDEFWS
jgi:ketosteroid isomerase-like protein